MTTTGVTDAQTLANAVWTLLDAIPAVTAYDGEFTRPDDDGNSVSFPPPLDPDGRVHAYAVYYPGPGWAHSVTLDQIPDSLTWTFQVTVVGGDRIRCLWAVGRVRAALSGIRIPTGDGQDVLIAEVGDPGQMRRDDDVSPSRMYLPLDFTVAA